MNTTLHGTLRSVYSFIGNLFFWPLTHIFLAISGWKQGSALVGFSLLAMWALKGIVFTALFPWLAYVYMLTGLITGFAFWYLFGTFKNGWFVYPLLVLTGSWVGIIVAILL